MNPAHWNAIVLAAGRGPGDPLAKAYGVTNKCLIPVGGVPMLTRVVGVLSNFRSVTVSIEDAALAQAVLGEAATTTPARSAPASVLAAVRSAKLAYPVLVTTGDHPLLTRQMADYFCDASERSGADFTVGLARAETILEAWPQAQRTFFTLARDRVSGCNLFALRNEKALRILERWQYLEQARKKPWRLAAAFGPAALLRYLTGRLTLDEAFATVSERLGIIAKPVIMPFAEAAIDVDKPADKELAEQILAARS